MTRRDLIKDFSITDITIHIQDISEQLVEVRKILKENFQGCRHIVLTAMGGEDILKTFFCMPNSIYKIYCEIEGGLKDYLTDLEAELQEKLKALKES